MPISLNIVIKKFHRMKATKRSNNVKRITKPEIIIFTFKLYLGFFQIRGKAKGPRNKIAAINAEFW